jgi:hypothetical protein
VCVCVRACVRACVFVCGCPAACVCVSVCVNPFGLNSKQIQKPHSRMPVARLFVCAPYTAMAHPSSGHADRCSRARSRGHADRCFRARSRSRTPTTQHGYQSPWLHFHATSLQEVLRGLDMLSGVPPFSLREFKARTKHHVAKHVDSRSGRSVSHFLSTMARSITAMIRARDEGDSKWEDILASTLRCAQLVLRKTDSSAQEATLSSLFDFFRNRCDAAAMSIMSERCLSTSGAPPWRVATKQHGAPYAWSNLSSIERRVALSMLEIINEDIQAACTDIKDALGSS